jgi:hypothetical protein
MIGKKINELATELAPLSTDLTIIGDPTTGVSKKITLEQISSLFGGSVSFYTNLAGFPAVGNIDIIYCAKDTNKLYLWSGSAYTEIFPSQALLDTYQLRSEKGNANGYASLDSGGKVPISQLPSSIMEYKGTWNASTNTPTLANGTGDTGDVYICNVAGTVNFGAGNITFAVGDYVIYSGTIWQRSSGAVGTVTSVAATITGDSVTISGSPVTTSGTLAFAFNGTTAQYIRGNGTLETFPSLTGFVPYTGATTNVNLGTHSLSAYDLIINHTSGSGVAAQITKGGNGEALTVVKSSGSGNAASITGGVTLLDELHLNTDLADAYIASATNWNAAYNDKINSAAVTGTTTKTLTLTQQDGGTITASWTDDNTDAVTSVFGRTGAVVAVSGDYTTSLVTEGTNLYFTNARARAAISAGTGISYNSSTGVITNTITQYTDALARAAISLTTTGTSGAATYNNTTGVLNIPQYADQFVGTVTSVGLSAPTGFSVSGSPVTSSGTLALSFASGYSLPTTAKQTTWDTAYDRSLTAASVSGTTTKTLTLTKQDGSTLTASWTDINTDAVTSVFGRTGAVVATSGDYTTAQVTESGNLYFTNARAIASTLTGYTSGAGTITSSDSILSAIQKLNGNIGALTTGVSSVNGLTGAVTLTTSNITEGTNLYYTEARVNANTNVAANTAARHNAVTIGTANGLSLSTQVLSLGLASTSTTGALSSTDWNTFNNKTSNTGTVTSVGLSSATSGVTIGSTPITTSGTITLAIATASGSQQGLLSSTDWTTFNNKQNALTNPVTGTGTTNYLPKFTGASTIGNSQIFDNGSNVGVGTDTPSALFTVSSVGFDDTFFRVEQRRSGYASAINLVGATDAGAIYNRISSQTNGGTTHWQIGGGAVANTMAFYTAGTLRMTLNNSGNLGLGVTPSAWSGLSGKVLEVGTAFGDKAALFQNDIDDLRLMSNVYFDGSFKYVRTGTATIFHSSNGSYKWSTAPSGSANAAISFTQAMTLDASGRLMINTTSQLGRLTVQGNTDGTDANLTLSRTETGATAYPTLLNLYNFNNGFAVGGSATIGYSAYGAEMFFKATARAGVDNINFYTKVGSTEFSRLYIANAGNVGIGNTNPGSYNAGVNNLVVGNLSGFTGITISSGNAQEGAINFADGLTGTELYRGAIAYSHLSDAMWFYTSGGEKMRITSGGSVGIGTTSPANRLQVNVSSNDTGGFIDASYPLYLRNTSTTANSYVGIYFGGGFGVGATIETQFVSPSTSDEGILKFATRNSSGSIAERMRITSDGRVGIGTSSPSTFGKLAVSVSGTGSKAGIGISNGGYNGTISSPTEIGLLELFSAGGTAPTGIYGINSYNDNSASWLSFKTTNGAGTTSTVMTITSGGNVGIGNTAPNSNLHVTGSVAKSHVTKSANYTLNATDYTVGFDCTGGDRTATLPDATTCTGRIYVIYQYNTGGALRGVLIDGNGSQTINGETLYYLKDYCAWTSVMIQSDGSNWIVIANAIQTNCL